MTSHADWHTQFEDWRIPSDWPALQPHARDDAIIRPVPVAEPNVYVLFRDGSDGPEFIGAAATLELIRHLAHDWVMTTGTWQLRPELRDRLDEIWPLYIKQWPLWQPELARR